MTLRHIFRARHAEHAFAALFLMSLAFPLVLEMVAALECFGAGAVTMWTSAASTERTRSELITGNTSADVALLHTEKGEIRQLTSSHTEAQDKENSGDQFQRSNPKTKVRKIK
jgi:hypothetical protein